MALVALSPWPDSADAVAVQAAVECLVAAVDKADAAKAERVGPVAAAMVQRYAPGAPQAVKSESVIRLVGWILGTPAEAIRSGSAGPLSVGYDTKRTSSAALRNSGAMGLLAAFRQHSAVAL